MYRTSDIYFASALCILTKEQPTLQPAEPRQTRLSYQAQENRRVYYDFVFTALEDGQGKVWEQEYYENEMEMPLAAYTSKLREMKKTLYQVKLQA